MTYHANIVVEYDDYGYYAYYSYLPECQFQGEIFKETMELFLSTVESE